MNKKLLNGIGSSILVASLLVAFGTTSVMGIFTDAHTASATITTASVTTSEVSSDTVVATNMLAKKSESHASTDDAQWESDSEIQISLQGITVTAEGNGVNVEGGNITITASGTYRISGTLTEGQLAIDTDEEDTVRLILDGADIHNSSSAAINVVNAEKVLIVLADGSDNYLSDGESYVYASETEDEPNATLFSKADLTITGSGSLSVDANYNDGIASKDGLVIEGGTIFVDAADDGIRCKDYLVVTDGELTVNASGDGLKSDNDEDASHGYIEIDNGNISIAAGGDAIQAETDVVISGGNFVLTSGGGSNAALADDASAKGIKAGVAVEILGGTFTIDAADDALHTNGTIALQGGTFAISTGDDGVHADVAIEMNGGELAISQSYEGIESSVITINNGTIHLVASDDGVNVAGGNDSADMGGGPRSNQDRFTYTGSEYLYINGGTIVVDAAGDGIDANGAIEMTDGVVIVNGPTMNMNAALDYDASFTLTGGFLITAGSSGMAQAPGTTSTQPSVLINFDSAQAAGTVVRIQDSEGDSLLTFAPAKGFQSIAFTSQALVNGSTYDVYLGGTVTGGADDGLYSATESDSGGTKYTSFTIADVVTTIGQIGRMRR